MENITAKRLKMLREEANITQSELALELGVSRQTVQLKEAGERGLSEEDIRFYSHFFKVSSDYILGLSDAKTSDKDVKFVCDYTGLNVEGIEFLHKAKYEENMLFEDVHIDFLNKYLEKAKDDEGMTLDLFGVREDALVCYNLFIEKEQAPSEEKQELYEKLGDVKRNWNGEKYGFSQKITEIMEDFSISSIDGLTYEKLKAALKGII